MSTYQHIIARQIAWAQGRGLPLVDSRGGDRGRPAYFPTITDNLFQPLTAETLECFRNGDGKEIGDYPHKPAKMRAVHSTSALAVNLFQYLGQIGRVDLLASASGLQPQGYAPGAVVFEEKYPVGRGFGIAPNVDVVVKPSDLERPVIAVECKFSEAYRVNESKGLKAKYLSRAELWPELPNLHRLALALSPDDEQFQFLHAAQLVKHILGLRAAYGGNFCLAYLYYEGQGAEGLTHAEEAAAFAEIARADGVLFCAITYQQLISRLAAELVSSHPDYVAYLTGRYM
ncbi:MAG: hypothetical protein KIS85_03615 [Anaerolineales bacterium]|nr:hypothetical protein [Anaerolineales bacterium]